MKEYNIAIVGATGVVGREIVSVLEERELPVKNLKFIAGDNSIGYSLSYKNKETFTDLIDKNSFKNIDIAFFCATKEISKEFVNLATESGSVVIDITGAFKDKKEIPMVVPEINKDDMGFYKNKGIIATPSCSATVASLVLNAIHNKYKIKRIIASIHQSVSEFGIEASEELMMQTKAWFEFDYDNIKPKVFNKKIAFNCIPNTFNINKNGYSEEEERFISEINKILHSNIAITATCFIAPIFRGHTEYINIETDKPFEIKDIKTLLKNSNGCKIIDNRKEIGYPTATDVVDKNEVFVGGIRKDFSTQNGLSIHLAADNLRKGSALNAVQIAEILIKEYL